MLFRIIQDVLVEGLWLFLSTASVASPAQRPLVALNAGTVLLSKSLDVLSLAASVASVAVRATQVKIIPIHHVMHLTAREFRAR